MKIFHKILLIIVPYIITAMTMKRYNRFMKEINNELTSKTTGTKLDLYKERYRYHQPKPVTNTSKRVELCGSHPDYASYFAMQFYHRSANNEDKTIYELFFKDSVDGNRSDIPKNGTIIEMGAFDGIRESNSRFFEVCLGWDTLLIEAMPKTFNRLVKNRPHVSLNHYHEWQCVHN